MRYFVKTLGGEKGPYEPSEIAESLRAGRLKKDTLLRPEDSTTTVSAESVVPREGTVAASDSPRRRRRAGPGDVYAPPDDIEEEVEAVRDRGNFGNGFAFGFFCGCIALIVSYVSKDMGSETKRGVRIGFAVSFAIGAVVRIIAALSR